ncbi:hypothetical protein GGX14DRAFT_699681 [Mycena pura]|uniref:Uncharacterized protein n=1 Tax=Mycena pura TaxID=153505 RepID=A0AAD6V5A6_9AGAR|nr:hypothetical protein GGX14DRAFT_699681 [Mycena pura]
MPHFSQEITECILDIVWNEHGRFSLLPCSLVSRAWLPRTRHLLFSTITLDLTRFEYNLERLNFCLAQLIDPDACTFTPFVQRLELYFKHLAYGWEEPFFAFIRVLPKYTSLVAIKIGRWRASELCKELRLHPLLDMLAHIPKLSDLVLGRGDLESAADFLRILNACPTLTALTIHEFYWPNAIPTSLDSPLSTAYPRAGTIQALRLEGDKIADVLDSFLAARRNRRARSRAPSPNPGWVACCCYSMGIQPIGATRGAPPALTVAKRKSLLQHETVSGPPVRIGMFRRSPGPLWSTSDAALEFVTQGLARATSHQVIFPPGDAVPGPRYSVPFFQNIGLDVKLAEGMLQCTSAILC